MMATAALAPRIGLPVTPLLRRLSTLAAIDPAVVAPLDRLAGHARRHPVRTMLTGGRQPGQGIRTLIEGWAAHSRILSDGRRQIVRLLLPGDVLPAGAPDSAAPEEIVTALTDVALAPAAAILDCADPDVVRAKQVDAAMQRTYLYNQITRLGRQSAIERAANLILELYDRLALAGATEGPERFSLPLTQETLSDILGLTTVHMNRTVQQLRRDRLVEMGRGHARILDRATLSAIADYRRLTMG